MDNDIQLFTDKGGLETVRRLGSNKNVGFHPNLKLLQGLSDEVTSKGVKAGSWMFDDHALGNELNIVVCAHREHAIEVKDNKKAAESYDSNSDLFKRIANINNTPSHYGMSGIDWLFYLPDRGKFCTYLAGKTSSRPLSALFADYIEKPANRRPATVDLIHTNCFVLTSEFVNRGPKYKCYEPRAVAVEYDSSWMPNKDDLESAVAVFSRPLKQAELEEADESETDR